MAPGGKRKRPERADSTDNPGRPSPHRPHNLQHAQQQQNTNARGGRRASSNRGRGGASAPNSPSVTQPSPSAMSPPAALPPSHRQPQVAPPSAAAPPTTAPSKPSIQPNPSKAPKSNQYLTQERVRAWTADGRGAVVEAGVQAQAEGDMLKLCLVFQELVQGCMDQVLSAEDLGATVRDILAAPPSDWLDPVSLFLDTVSTLTETGVLHASLKPLLEASGVDPARMRAELESDLLRTLDLIRPTFNKIAIRKATMALYRQSNYNLLREETEGYSKLITEYFTTVNNEPPTGEAVADTFQRVKALIGTFDLDVGRVLDVTLDVFANLLVKHNRFFVKFLRASSWWPEQKVTHGVEWEEPKVCTLPQWASLGSEKWHYSDEEKEEQRRLREQRDQEFWTQVDKSGIKAWFELGARKITGGLPSPQNIGDTAMADDTETSEKKLTEAADFEKTQKWLQEWMTETRTLPPSGNRIAAQLLGFKLRFYASDARDANDTLPDNLIYLAALLIKIGFISLADLYPHIYPLDENMPAHRDKLMKAKKDKEDKLRGVSTNALAMAAALPDDTLPAPAPVARLRESESKASSRSETDRGTPPRMDEDSKDKLPDPVDQKVALLRSLLCIGAIPEALFILSRFPWLLDVYPDLHIYMFRLAHHSLSKVYESSRPFSELEVPMVAKQGPTNGNSQAAPRASDFAPRRTLRWAKLEERDAGEGIDYRFYWDDWADNVPICQSVDDVFRLYNSLLKFVGLECGKDAVLLTKLARIGKKSLAEDPSLNNLRRWTTFSATFLGPALTFSGRNPGVVNEAWELFKHFDTPTRYIIYTTWFNGPAKRQPAMQAKFLEVTTETKRLFNRINNENTRAMGRALAKPAYACPGVVFERALKTAENYSNMTDPLVECCRYLTYLGYDCLNWTFINSLKEERPAVQGDGMLAKPWLKNTAFFIGKAYRRYSLMDPTPILQFLADQLLRGKLFMLEILEQLVTSMAGIGPPLGLTESQVHGLSAGPLLQAFTLEHYLGDKRHQAKVTAKRLLKCLKEAGLTAQILVAMAIELEQYVFRDEHEEADTPLKVIGANLDSLHANFTQYLDFLRSFLSVEEFDTLVPGLVELMSVYGVGPGVAFTIVRSSLAIQINAARSEKKNSQDEAKLEPEAEPKAEDSTPNSIQANGDVSMEGTEDAPAANGVTFPSDMATKKDASEDSETKESPATTDVEMKDSPSVDTPAAPNGSREPSTTIQGKPNSVIEALADGLKTAMPDIYGNHICLNFFVTFWQLSLVDVFTVTSMKEMKEYTAAWKSYAEKASRVPYDRRDVSAQAVERRRAEIQGYNNQSAAFRTEAKETLEAALKMREHLQEEMHQWFDGIPMVDARSEDLHDAILQDCFLPRILQSSQDAQFAAAMLKFMHEIGVPGFRTMKFLDQLFRHKMLTGVIFMCSSRESQNLGRFLNDVLKELNLWHSSQANYIKLSQGQRKSLPGFGRTFHPDRTPATFLDYEDFRRVLFKWHTQLFRGLEACFKSDDYMHIRNAINVLKATASSFPKIDSMGKNLYQMIQDLSQNDSRDDLKLAAMSLLGDLKKGEKFWVAPQAFHHTRNALTSANSINPASRTSSEQPRTQTPQPADSAAARLSATAPEFNPRTANTNGTVTPTAGNARTNGESNDDTRRPVPATTGSEAHGNDREPIRPSQGSTEPRPTVPPRRNDADPKARDAQQDVNPAARPSALPTPPVPRPDNRSAPGHPSPAGRTPHNLPPRPEAQALRSRPPERSSDRQSDFNTPSRAEVRPNAPSEFGPGRHERAGDSQREPYADRREISPARRPRGRTPERRDASWGGREPRDARDPRDYVDERSMRPPPRDVRGTAPPQYHPRDVREPRDMRDTRDPRDIRDARDRGDPRGLPPPSQMDSGRARLHSTPTTAPDNAGHYRRDYPPVAQQGGERSANLPPRQLGDRSSTGAPSPATDRSLPGSERAMINPERAALINDDRSRNETFRSDRDRGSRPQSPRRGHDRPPAPYPVRSEAGRDHHRDDRDGERAMHDRTPPHNLAPNRDRRDEPTGVAPTGPRGGRNDASLSSRGVSRDMFMPHAPSRPSTHQAQDPNYGRLNPPSDTIPSGPRSMISTQALPSMANQASGLAPDRRNDTTRREPMEQPPAPGPQAAPTAPAGAATAPSIHPSRLQMINPPTIQTNVVNPPSGPRGQARTPSGPAASPVSSRAPPTGPASARGQDRTALRAINNLLSQSQPSGNNGDPSTSGQSPQVRGRGSTRASGFDGPNVPSPVGSSSHPGTPNTSRPEGPLPSRSERTDTRPQDDTRLDSRGHREGRRSERSGRQRSRSPDRGDRRADERSTRNGPRTEEQEWAGDRDRGPSRDKRGGDRESGRRERERDGEHSTREGRERRDRGGREDGRGSGRGEEAGSRRGAPPVGGEPPAYPGDGRGDHRGGDNRNRSGNDRRDDNRGERRRDEQRGGDGRKRGPGDEANDPRNAKRSRRSNG